MERKENLRKLSQFWLIPLFIGSLLATGYKITNKAFVHRNQLRESKNRLLLKKMISQEDLEESYQGIHIKQNGPTQGLEKDIVIKNSSNKTNLKATQKTLLLDSKNLESKDKVSTPLSATEEIDGSSEKLTRKHPTSFLKDEAPNIESNLEKEKRIFQKLFKSLPDP